MKEFAKRNIQVIAASADSWEKALQTVERYRLTFRIGHSLNPPQISSLTGAFYNAQDNYLHATGFILGPDEKVENAVYSSRSIGRLIAQDCLDFIGS
jgi:alkyl hydroperoxide reductase subunit AhpC